MNQYHLIIPFWGDDISEDFGLRDVVVEYLEETLQSEVYEEGTGIDGMHVFFNSDLPKSEIQEKIRSVLHQHSNKKLSHIIEVVS